jgi:hypothetical protein
VVLILFARVAEYITLNSRINGSVCMCWSGIAGVVEIRELVESCDRKSLFTVKFAT